MRVLVLAATMLAVCVLTVRPIRSAEPSDDILDLLRQAAHFSNAEVTAVQRGQAVARVLETERTEVAVAGAVWIRAPRERILDRYRDLSLLTKNEMVLQVGRFGAAPHAGDLRDLVFEPYDLESLRECEPGDCAVRLTAATMARFQQGVDWRAADWQARAADLWRTSLAEYAAEYRAHGDASLAEYHNKEAPLRLQDQFTILFRASPFVTPFAPEFLRYLQEYPRVAMPGAEDIFYWSKDNFGLRPVLSITHLSLHTPPPGAPARAALVGTKQIYATHYFDAALGITIAIDDRMGGSYMVVINRARTRSLTSRFRGFARGIVQGRGRDGLERMLRSTKDALERSR
jgi:hypothetical protein